MTDFRRVPAAAVAPGASLEEARSLMLARAVRLLLVGDRSSRLEGLLTAEALLGERPIQEASLRRLGVAELCVRDVMERVDRLDVLHFADVLVAEVGHVLASLKHLGRRHVLVVEDSPRGLQVRGLFSASQLARQLGIEPDVCDVALTFADIEAALVC